MAMNKDLSKVVDFMRLFGKLKDWSDDDPDSLPDLASTDESIIAMGLPQWPNTASLFVILRIEHSKT